LKAKAGSALKQQVQFRLIPENHWLGMISLHHWTGGYSIPVCGSSWVTDIMRTAGRGGAATPPSDWADVTTWMGDRNSSIAGQ
jgi:hypothetical protein